MQVRIAVRSVCSLVTTHTSVRGRGSMLIVLRELKSWTKNQNLRLCRNHLPTPLMQRNQTFRRKRKGKIPWSFLILLLFLFTFFLCTSPLSPHHPSPSHLRSCMCFMRVAIAKWLTQLDNKQLLPGSRFLKKFYLSKLSIAWFIVVPRMVATCTPQLDLLIF